MPYLLDDLGNILTDASGNNLTDEGAGAGDLFASVHSDIDAFYSPMGSVGPSQPSLLYVVLRM